MTVPPRTPPRFVPTLTDVVQVPGTAQFAPSRAEDVPQPQPQPLPAADQVEAARSPAAGPGHLPDGIEEYVVHRLMQRVDLVLDQRLREAIALVVQEQTRSMVPRLREEVESVVRHAVYEAVAEELARDGR